MLQHKESVWLGPKYSIKLGECCSKKNDFSIFDEICHPDFKGLYPIVDEVELNIDRLKKVLQTLKDLIIFTSLKTLAEEDTFLKVQGYNNLKEGDILSLVTVAITYKDGKIINQEYLFEELNYDPSEGQDWNWEDYE